MNLNYLALEYTVFASFLLLHARNIYDTDVVFGEKGMLLKKMTLENLYIFVNCYIQKKWYC